MQDTARTVVPFPDGADGGPDRDAVDARTRIARLEGELAVARRERDEAEAALAAVESGFETTATALRRANAELRLIFDHVPAAVVLCAADGSVVNANVTAHDWLGAPDSAMLGRELASLMPPACRERERRAHARALGGAAPETGEEHRLDVPGHPPRWVRTARVPLAREGSDDTMVLVTSEDCTARREGEARAEFFRSRMELALEASNTGMWDQFPATGAAFWCERMKALMGVGPAFSPRPGDFAARVHPDDAEEVRRVEAEHAASGEPYTLHARVVHPDGTVRRVVRSGRSFRANGTVERFTGTLVDETALAAELDRSEALVGQLRLAERLSRTGYWSLPLDGTGAPYWSDQVWTILGLARGTREAGGVEEALARFHPEDAARIRERFAAAREHGESLELGARVVAADGSIRHVSMLGLVRAGPGGASGGRTLFGVIADVTSSAERELGLERTRDALARSNEELSRFGYVCSHDMKEPVRVIESMAALLAGTDLEAEPELGRRLAERIGANTARLRAVIDGLLAYSRVEARVESGPVDLGRVVGEVRENLAVALAESRATLEADPLPTVRGARVRFVQLLQNLVGNALAYSHRDRPRVRVRDESAPRAAGAEPGPTVLVVEDDGPGIAPEQRDRVFETFTRLELDGEVEGTGLGLSICRRIVRQYGGTIECVDGTLGGAAFRIVLPGPAEDVGDREGGDAGEGARGG